MPHCRVGFRRELPQRSSSVGDRSTSDSVLWKTHRHRSELRLPLSSQSWYHPFLCLRHRLCHLSQQAGDIAEFGRTGFPSMTDTQASNSCRSWYRNPSRNGNLPPGNHSPVANEYQTAVSRARILQPTFRTSIITTTNP